MICFDRNPFAIKTFHGVLDELLIEHWEDLLCYIVHSNLVELNQLRVYASQIFVNNVVQLGGELDASGPSPNDREIQELLALLIRRRRQSCGFEAGQDAVAYSASVTYVF